MDQITTPAATYTPPATAILHHTQASFTNRELPQPVHLVQYDDTVPILAVELSANGQPYSVPAGAALNIRMDKRDGHYIYNPALGLNEGRTVAYIAVTQQMTTGAGDFSPIIEVVVDGGVAGTAALSIWIDKNPVPEDAIESTDEYQTVQQLVLDAKAAADAAAASKTAAQTSQSAAASSAASAQASAQEADASKSAAASSAAAAAESQTAAADSQSAAADSATAAQEAAEQAQQVAQGSLGYYVDADALRAAHPTGTAGQWAIVGSTDSIWVWDVEGGAWKDSGQSVDLSNYYTKLQTDARINATLGRPVTIPVPASGWQGEDNGPWTNAVSVEGVTALTELSNILPAAASTEEAQKAALQWQMLDTGAGMVTFTATETKPTVDFTLTAIARETKGADEDAAE